MQTSLFQEYVDKYFSQLVGAITEKYNDKSKEQEFMFRTMLTESYSADMTWQSTTINHNIVAADVVSLDSTLPLKKRSSLSIASGRLPKLGVKYRKGEKDISDINVMIARGNQESQIVAKIFDDVSKATKAIDVRTEIMFLNALSTGVCLVDNNDETGIRVNFGYKAENAFTGINGGWSSDNTATVNPIDDLRQLFDKADADGNTIGHVYLSLIEFNYLRTSDAGKLLAAAYNNQVITQKTLLPTPTRSTFLEALRDEFGAEFHIVNSSYRIENNDGTFTTVKPFNETSIVAVPSTTVGRLVYGTLAAETNPVAGVEYQKAGSHILVSKFSEPEPLQEFTAAQALCMPIIEGVDEIYTLDTTYTAPSLE